MSDRSEIMKLEFWIPYCLLLLLRLAITLTSTGYIHPDEFFQNPEASSAFIFREANMSCLKTWEFNSPQIRSLTIPLLTTGIPFALVKYFFLGSASDLPSTLAIFWGPRIMFFLMSLCMDVCVMVIGKRFSNNMHWRRCLLFLATAWPVLTFGVRSFSNTIELDLLVVLLCVVANPAAMSYARAIAVPVLGALGLFTRFTFVAFAAPLALYHVFRCVYTYDAKQKTYILLPMKRCFGLVFVSVASFCMSIAALVCSDTYLFTGEVSLSSLVIAPLNFLKYNSDPANLALHGTHPRWLHLLVNLPLLALPLLPTSIINSVGSFTSEVSEKWRRGPVKALPLLCGAVIFSSMAILSVAPHQELRFLLPLIFPLLILSFWEDKKKTDDEEKKKDKKQRTQRRRRSVDDGCFGCLFVMWTAYNMLFTCYFGFAQQGGVIPSLMNIGERIKLSDRVDGGMTHNIIYWHTYMPPRHLLTARKTAVNVTDLASAPESRLLESIDSVIDSANRKRVCEQLWVVIPSIEKKTNEKLQQRSLEMNEVFVPHIGLDNDEMKVYKSAMFSSSSSSRSVFEKYAGLNLYHKQIGACGDYSN